MRRVSAGVSWPRNAGEKRRVGLASIDLTLTRDRTASNKIRPQLIHRRTTMSRRRAFFRVRSLLFLAAVLIVGSAPRPGELRAAQRADSKLKLFFSDRPNDPAPRSFLPLRPNVQQQF